MAGTSTQPNNVSVKFKGTREMAKLTTKKRDKIPTKDFAGPGRSYPVEDRGHAIAAKGRAKQMRKRGIISDSEYNKIVAKADRKLDE
jgi:hypothetical protein